MTFSQSNEDLYQRFLEQRKSVTVHFLTSNELVDAFRKSRDAILAEMQKVFPAAKVWNVGPDMAERSGWWGCYIEVDTDKQRDLFRCDDLLLVRLRQAGTAGGFPPVSVEIESSETVRRDYEGNWFLRLR